MILFNEKLKISRIDVFIFKKSPISLRKLSIFLVGISLKSSFIILH